MRGFRDSRSYLWSLLIALAFAAYVSHTREVEDNSPKQRRELYDCEEDMCPVKKKHQSDAKEDTSYNGWRLGSTCSDG